MVPWSEGTTLWDFITKQQVSYYYYYYYCTIASSWNVIPENWQMEMLQLHQHS